MARFYAAFVAFFLLIVWQPISALAQPAALAELFCSFGCDNCPGPDSLYNSYLSKNPNVVLINYHNAITDGSDLFYIESEPASLDRNNLYGLSEDPTAFIDGYNAGSIEGDWVTETNDALNNSFPGSITSLSVSQGPSVSGGNIDTISFTVTGLSSVSGPVNYYVAIKQSQIYYNNSGEGYGNPPGDIWNDVFRTMLPGGNGSSPFSLSGTHKFDTIYDPSKYNYGADEQNMTAVIFVQDVNPTIGTNGSVNYQIEALDTIPLTSPAGVSESTTPTTRLIIPANPISSQGAFAFELASAGNVQLNLYDMLGRQVRTLVAGMMPSGETTVDMNGASLAPGCYIARLVVNGQDADQSKFIVTP